MLKNESGTRTAPLRRFTHSTAEQAIASCVELRTALETAGERDLMSRLDEALRHLKLLRDESGFLTRDPHEDLSHLEGR